MNRFPVLTTMAMTGLLATAASLVMAAPCPPDGPRCGWSQNRDGAIGADRTPAAQRGRRDQAGSEGDELRGPERTELLRMQQEEKLARDVYRAMARSTGLGIFENIGAAEQRHLNAVTRMIDAYGVEDPIVDDTPGVFVDPAFRKLYDDLVKDGSGSRSGALMVGARVEEMDIVDLREAVRATTHRDLIRVYENLLRATRNHLRAFAAQLAAEGQTYKARYLTQKDFDAIASSPRERGGGAGQGSGRIRAGNGQCGECGQPAHGRARQGVGRKQARACPCGACG